MMLHQLVERPARALNVPASSSASTFSASARTGAAQRQREEQRDHFTSSS